MPLNQLLSPPTHYFCQGLLLIASDTTTVVRDPREVLFSGACIDVVENVDFVSVLRGVSGVDVAGSDLRVVLAAIGSVLSECSSPTTIACRCLIRELGRRSLCGGSSAEELRRSLVPGQYALPLLWRGLARVAEAIGPPATMDVSNILVGMCFDASLRTMSTTLLLDVLDWLPKSWAMYDAVFVAWRRLGCADSSGSDVRHARVRRYLSEMYRIRPDDVMYSLKKDASWRREVDAAAEAALDEGDVPSNAVAHHILCVSGCDLPSPLPSAGLSFPVLDNCSPSYMLEQIKYLVDCVCPIAKKRVDSCGPTRSYCECAAATAATIAQRGRAPSVASSQCDAPPHVFHHPFVVGSGAHGFAAVVLCPPEVRERGGPELGVLKSARSLASLKHNDSNSVKTKSDHYRRCFENEVAVLRQLDHVNIVRLLAVYPSMPAMLLELACDELCTATTMSAFVRQSISKVKLSDVSDKLSTGFPVDAQQSMLITDLALQSARGLQAVHDKGFIHRDIKTANILLSTRQVVTGRDGSGRRIRERVHTVKLCDFGLAVETSQGR